MTKYTFKFRGYSEAVTSLFGRIKPGQEIVLGYTPGEEKKIKDNGEYPEGTRYDVELALRLAPAAQWESVSKTAKDLETLFDSDHVICADPKKENTDEHMKYFHGAMYDAWKSRLGG